LPETGGILDKQQERAPVQVFPKATVLHRFIAKSLDVLIVLGVGELTPPYGFWVALWYVLVADGFDDESPPPALASQAFFDAAWAALSEPGVMVLNLMDDDPRLDATLQRLENAFGGAVLCMPALADPNVIAFALKGAPPRIAWQSLRERWPTLIPLIKSMAPAFGGDQALMPLWWSLSLGACLGGNGTLIGASANLTVVGLAERAGVSIRFVPFLLIAFPLMLVSILISSLYIYLRYLL